MFSNAAVEDATWTAPATTTATQVVTLTLTVTDMMTGPPAALVSRSRSPVPTRRSASETEDQDVAGGHGSPAPEATSADSDGTIATYAWTADPAEGTFSDAAVEDATWTAPATTTANQVFTLTLTVTDSDGATAMASVTIMVPSGPTVSIETVDQTVAGGTVVELVATSREDGMTSRVVRLWTAGPGTDTVGTFSNAAVEDATWTAPATTAATQVVTLTLTVTDSDDMGHRQR